MFEGLQDKFQEVFRRLKGEGKITQEHLQAALKQIRLALLEADVHFKVVKGFLERVEAQALGQEVLGSLSPDQQVLRIVLNAAGGVLIGKGYLTEEMSTTLIGGLLSIGSVAWWAIWQRGRTTT